MLLFQVEEQGGVMRILIVEVVRGRASLVQDHFPAGRPHSRRRGHCPQPGLKAAKAGECCPVPGPWPTEQDVPQTQAQNQP